MSGIYGSGGGGSFTPRVGGKQGIMLMAKTEPLARMFNAMEMFRTLDAEIQAQTVEVFLLIASGQAETMAKVADKLGIAQSSVSRNIRTLGKWKQPNVVGHDLIEVEIDPANMRQRIITLTSKGRRFAEALQREIDG